MLLLELKTRILLVLDPPEQTQAWKIGKGGWSLVAALLLLLLLSVGSWFAFGIIGIDYVELEAWEVVKQYRMGWDGMKKEVCNL
ncbi:unnamed protein product [Orchesella dallaii]|uniref:Uncharacterized protein n=1 Tax=Orchesella dallaii TaxID=48710 RepID=A0ABP1PNY9_9HEXA